MLIITPGDPVGSEVVHRLVWCPFVPEPDSDLDTQSGQRMLVLTHGAVAEVWSLNTVLEEHGSGPLTPADVEHGLMTIKEIGGDIVDAAFSPTGEAVAIAVNDGHVKFFQVRKQITFFYTVKLSLHFANFAIWSLTCELIPTS